MVIGEASTTGLAGGREEEEEEEFITSGNWRGKHSSLSPGGRGFIKAKLYQVYPIAAIAQPLVNLTSRVVFVGRRGCHRLFPARFWARASWMGTSADLLTSCAKSGGGNCERDFDSNYDGIE